MEDPVSFAISPLSRPPAPPCCPQFVTACQNLIHALLESPAKEMFWTVSVCAICGSWGLLHIVLPIAMYVGRKRDVNAVRTRQNYNTRVEKIARRRLRRKPRASVDQKREDSIGGALVDDDEDDDDVEVAKPTASRLSRKARRYRMSSAGGSQGNLSSANGSEREAEAGGGSKEAPAASAGAGKPGAGLEIALNFMGALLGAKAAGSQRPPTSPLRGAQQHHRGAAKQGAAPSAAAGGAAGAGDGPAMTVAARKWRAAARRAFDGPSPDGPEGDAAALWRPNPSSAEEDLAFLSDGADARRRSANDAAAAPAPWPAPRGRHSAAGEHLWPSAGGGVATIGEEPAEEQLKLFEQKQHENGGTDVPQRSRFTVPLEPLPPRARSCGAGLLAAAAPAAEAS